MRLTDGRRRLVATLVLFIGAAWAPGASADDHDHVRGVIAGRAAGGALVLYADDGTNVTVIAQLIDRQRKTLQQQEVTIVVEK